MKIIKHRFPRLTDFPVGLQRKKLIGIRQEAVEIAQEDDERMTEEDVNAVPKRKKK